MADRLKLALTSFQQGDSDKALAILEKFLSKTKNNAFAWFLSAVIYTQKGKLQSAIRGFEKAIEIQPNYPEALNNMGVTLEADNRIKEAEIYYRKAIEQNKKYANAYYNLANIQKNENLFDDAIDNYLLAIKHNPNYSNAMNNLALLYQYHGSYTKSEALFNKAISISGSDNEIRNNLGFNYCCLHKYDKALVIFQEILSAVPNYAATQLNFGLLMQSMNQLNEARDYFLKASENPEYHTRAMNNLAYLELSIGNFEAGWQYYRYRPSVRNTTFKTLDNLPDNLAGKSILLYKDQGIGDEIFLSRYIPIFEKYGAQLSYYTDQKLISFWQRTFPNIVILGAEPIFNNFDYVISIGELPRLLYQDGYKDIPPSTKLIPESTAIEHLKNSLPHNGKKNIAVTWEAGVPGQNTLFKQIPPSILGEHLSPLDSNILLLQRNAKAKDIKEFEKALGRKTFNYTFANDNLEEMLALLSLVDEYACVSNTNTHLMAALNRPAHVFVPHPPEWRWLNTGDLSPWFPACRLYRQDHSGSWKDSLTALDQVLTYKLTN